MGVTFDHSGMREPLMMAHSSLGWRGIPEGMLDEDEEPSPASVRTEFLPSPEPRRRPRVRFRPILARALFAIVFGAVLALFAHEILLVIKLGARPF